MPRKPGMLPPRIHNKYPVTVYLISSDEALAIRVRARELGKNLSQYFREMALADIASVSQRTAKGEVMYTPFQTSQLPPGFTPGDDISFYTPEQLEEQQKESEAREQELQDLLKDI
jgi:hypothetical protein